MEKKKTKQKQIEELRTCLASADQDTKYYRDIVSQVNKIMGVSNSSDTISKVIDYVSYRKFNEGAYRPESETVHILKEIIRWNINPETALESKVQDLLTKQRGF